MTQVFRTPDSQPSLQGHVSVNALLEPGRINITLAGRAWALSRPADLESLWESISDEEFSADERLPYWVELWPSSLVLALWLSANQDLIAGRCCLDIGCGLGLTALVGSLAGARVIGMDYEPAALRYARCNAHANQVPQPLWTVMDWRRPAMAARSCDFIWAGDVMYENRFVGPVFDFLAHALTAEGKVWMAEPGRTAYALFRQTLFSRGWRSRRVADTTVDALHVQTSPVSVKLWELSRA